MADTTGSHTEDGNVPDRVRKLQEGYRRRSELTGTETFEWRWYGKWWNPDAFKRERYISPCYCEDASGEQRVSGEVLDSWLLLDERATIALEQKYICAYHMIVKEMCEKIRNFGALPRSTPRYNVAAARHPLGIVLHGQRLRTGETLQLVASIEHNKPVWMFIGACVYKILEEAQKEKPAGEGQDKWAAFVECIKNTLGLMGKRGLTRLYPPVEELTEQEIREAGEYLMGDPTVGDLEKAITADILTVFCGAPPKNKPDGQAAEYAAEYMAHVPHMFEWYLRKKISEEASGYFVNKEKFPFPRRKHFENTVEPDVVVRRGGENGEIGPVVACIDAKLKFDGTKNREDLYQMAVFTEALERANAGGGRVKGVVFVAVYGDQNGYDDEHSEEPEGGEIRFMFCHLHKQGAESFEKKLTEKVKKALEFLGLRS